MRHGENFNDLCVGSVHQVVRKGREYVPSRAEEMSGP